MHTIGTMKEGSLHANLKEWYMVPGDKQEVTVDGYDVDILHGEVLIEIQTCNFASIKNKLNDLVEKHKVRLVYPIPTEKWIIQMTQDNKNCLGKRKSPQKRGTLRLFKSQALIISNPIPEPPMPQQTIFSISSDCKVMYCFCKDNELESIFGNAIMFSYIFPLSMKELRSHDLKLLHPDMCKKT